MALERIILGCGNFGGIGSDLSLVGTGESEADAFAVMDAAWSEGLRRFDTASSYGGGESERIIGRWIASRKPDGLTLTSKAFHPVDEGDDSGLSPTRLRRVVHESLDRLGVERIDLYMVHEPDPATPLADTLGALDELVREGAVGAIGLSNVDVAYIREAVALTRISAVQNECSLLVREAEREILPLCAEHGIEFQCFSPLAGGWLTGKYRQGEPFPEGSRMTLRPDAYEAFMSGDVFEQLARFETIAASRGIDRAVLALAWLLSDERIGAIVVGPRRPEQLEPALRAQETVLAPPLRAELEDVFA